MYGFAGKKYDLPYNLCWKQFRLLSFLLSEMYI